MNKVRTVIQIIKGMPCSDGDGVQLIRIIGSPYLNMLDPFLLLDAFGSDKPQDYIGGFPSHPHRGFQTVTYMLTGKMRHKDSAGNEGVIEAGGVQWMSAGKDIIHSEMPEQEQGLLAGFQLWVNLPATNKMSEPKYQEYSADEIPIETRSSSISLKVIAGRTRQGTYGVIKDLATDPIYWDVSHLRASEFEDRIATGHNAFIYVIEGEISITGSDQILNRGQLAVLSDGESVSISSNDKSRYLIVAGKPLNEPVERVGPFVMNTRKEIDQAFSDYQTGRLA